MSALVRKEIRLLLPTFLAALALALTTFLIPRESPWQRNSGEWLAMLPNLGCPMLVILMALQPFGGELAAGTFSGLLAQPSSRARIWWLKSSLLALAMLLVGTAWCLAHALVDEKSGGMPFSEFALGVGLFGAAALSGGLWTVLLLRQVAAAFWFTVLIPGLLVVFLAHWLEREPEKLLWALSSATAVYAAAGFWWGYRLFLRAEDLAWTGGEVTWPWAARRSVQPARQTVHHFRPWQALVGKEFRLHQSSVAVAGFLALTHLLVRLLRLWKVDYQDAQVLEFFVNQFWLVWTIMPVLVGCEAAAEERKLGTLEAQLCLPMAPLRQWLVKGAVTLVVALVLGLGGPTLLDASHVWADVRNALWQWLTALSVLTLISFYASSIARNTLQAMAPAGLGLVCTWMLLITSWPGAQVGGFVLWSGPLMCLLLVPALVIVILRLSFLNYRSLLPSWAKNLGVLVATMVGMGTVTSLTYHRAWEHLMRREPDHGALALSVQQTSTLRSSGNLMLVQLGDGRAWLNGLIPKQRAGGAWYLDPVLPHGRWVDGKNWTHLAVAGIQLVGLRDDGTLWRSADSESLRELRNGDTARSQPVRMVPVGQENDWQVMEADYAGVYLLKRDGSLWRWQAITENPRQKQPAREELTRLSGSGEWKDFIRLDYRLCLRRRDGTAWVTFGGNGSRNEVLKLGAHTVLERAKALDRADWRNMTRIWGGRSVCYAAVEANGSLELSIGFEEMGARRSEVDLGRDWKQVAAFSGDSMLMLKNDGSLWYWRWQAELAQVEWRQPQRYSRHADWIGVEEMLGGVITLAADGGLWFWQVPDSQFSPFEHSRTPYLATSRKPQSLGNVLRAE